MESNEVKKIKNKVERVVLSPLSVKRLDHWIDQVQGLLPGVKVNRQTLVDWMIGNRDDEFSHRELSDIRKALFDEVAFTQWALKKLKQARSEGVNLSLSDVLGDGKGLSPAKKLKPRKKKDSPTTTGLGSEPNV